MSAGWRGEAGERTHRERPALRPKCYFSGAPCGPWRVASPVGSTGRGVSPDALCTWVHTVAPWGWSSRPHHQAEETRRQRAKLPAQWDLENPTALGELTSC